MRAGKHAAVRRSIQLNVVNSMHCIVNLEVTARPSANLYTSIYPESLR